MKQAIYWFLGLGLVLSLSACQMRADSGLWRGTVTVEEDFQRSYSCTLELEITHTNEDLILHRISNSCFAYSSSWRAGKFELFGNTVWKSGRVVGSVGDDGSGSLELDSLTMDERYPFPANSVRLLWNRTGIGLSFTEEAFFAGRTVRTSGWLTKVR